MISFMTPKRYAIAYIDALVALGVSETDAFKAAAARTVGIPMGCRGLVQGGVLVNYENGSNIIVGKADTLRRKFKRPMSSEEGMWRVAMGHAFLLAVRGKELHRCALTIEDWRSL
jgi:hypothetical protein